MHWLKTSPSTDQVFLDKACNPNGEEEDSDSSLLLQQHN